MTLEVVKGVRKSQKIVKECEETGEPYFVFRAKDILSIFPLKEYERIVEMYGPTDHEMLMGIANAIEEFRTWQREHVGIVRYPD